MEERFRMRECITRDDVGRITAPRWIYRSSEQAVLECWVETAELVCRIFVGRAAPVRTIAVTLDLRQGTGNGTTCGLWSLPSAMSGYFLITPNEIMEPKESPARTIFFAAIPLEYSPARRP